MSECDEMNGWQLRASEAQAKAAQAYGRLLELAETRSGGQIRYVARFLAATFDGAIFPLNPDELRGVDVSISDDMLACLDAHRWGRADLYKLVPRGHDRVLAICTAWNLKWPE